MLSRRASYWGGFLMLPNLCANKCFFLNQELKSGFCQYSFLLKKPENLKTELHWKSFLVSRMDLPIFITLASEMKTVQTESFIHVKSWEMPNWSSGRKNTNLFKQNTFLCQGCRCYEGKGGGGEGRVPVLYHFLKQFFFFVKWE